MKTIITLCLAVFFVAGIQNTQAQTKEETIAWIKEKLESSTKIRYCPVGKIKVSSITECSITVTYQCERYNGLQNESETFPVKNVEVGDGSTGYLNYPGEMVINHNGFRSNSTSLYIVETEINLKDRFQKAMNHLATFCEEKKQTF